MTWYSLRVSAYELSNNNKWRWCLQPIFQRTHSPNQLVWSEGWRPGLSLHSLNEPGELSQWLCHDDSTINIVVVIIIIIIIITWSKRRIIHWCISCSTATLLQQLLQLPMQPTALTEYTMQSPLQQVASMTVVVIITIILITDSPCAATISWKHSYDDL